MIQLIVLIVSCVLCFNAGYDGAMADIYAAVAVVMQSFAPGDISDADVHVFRSHVAIGAAVFLNLSYYFYVYRKNKKKSTGP